MNESIDTPFRVFMGQGHWQMTLALDAMAPFELMIVAAMVRELEAQQPGLFDDAPVRLAAQPTPFGVIGLTIEGEKGIAGHAMESLALALRHAGLTHMWSCQESKLVPEGEPMAAVTPSDLVEDDPTEQAEQAQAAVQMIDSIVEHAHIMLLNRAAWLGRLRAAANGTHEPAIEQPAVLLSAQVVALALLDGEALSLLPDSWVASEPSQELLQQMDIVAGGFASRAMDVLLPGVRQQRWAALGDTHRQMVLGHLSAENRASFEAALQQAPRPSRRFN